MFNNVLQMHLSGMQEIEQPGALHKQWQTRLQHALPTPAELLIGSAVHDAKTGSDAASQWEWSDATASEGRLSIRQFGAAMASTAGLWRSWRGSYKSARTWDRSAVGDD